MERPSAQWPGIDRPGARGVAEAAEPWRPRGGPARQPADRHSIPQPTPERRGIRATRPFDTTPGPSRVATHAPLPLVLAHRVGSRRLVFAACAHAQRLGIAPGLAVGQAQALVPGLAVHEAEPRADAADLVRLAHWAARAVSPLAAAAPPDGLFIDATGLAHLFGGEAALIARLQRRMARLGVAAIAAIAGTPGAAHALARFGGGGALAPGGEAKALAPLTVAALRLAPDTIDALARVGARTVADLLALPRAPLVRRFGQVVADRLDQAFGRAPEPIEPVAPPPSLAARLLFLEPLTTTEPLAEAMRHLAADLALRLAAGGLGARRLSLAFTRVDGHTQRIAAGTAAPSRDAAHFARLLVPKLETVDPGFGIERAQLVATLVERLEPRQLGTDPPAPDLAELVDRLSNRPEAASVHRVGALERDLPERSIQREPALNTALARWPEHLPRPPRLITPPERVEAIAMLPDYPPVRFTWRGQRHQVRCADGPERLFGEWWRAPAEHAQVRDYYQIETDSGFRAWLFRAGDGADAATGDMSWWLHGVFG